MDLQYSEKRFYARVSLSSVFPPTAVWRAAVAEARSAMRRSCLAVEQFFSVIVPVEGIGNVVISSAEPLAVFSNFVRELVCCMKTCYFDLDGGLDGVLAILDKIRFLNQPSEVVLSVIESAQSPFVIRPAMMSIHGVIIAVRCSRRLFDARNCRLSGS
jgi:hypothetical protein